MRGSLSWLSGVIDNAIYPVLFAGTCVTRAPNRYICIHTHPYAAVPWLT